LGIPFDSPPNENKENSLIRILFYNLKIRKRIKKRIKYTAAGTTIDDKWSKLLHI
jgi:hypothetical protein